MNAPPQLDLSREIELEALCLVANLTTEETPRDEVDKLLRNILALLKIEADHG